MQHFIQGGDALHAVVIGNSAAGLAAAGTIRKNKPNTRVTVISNEPGPAYARCLIPDVLAGTKDVQGINYVAQDFYQEYGIELLAGKKVISIDVAGRIVNTADGQAISYDKLLVATGASPVIPNWPGSMLPGVFTLRTAQQAAAAGKLAANCVFAVVVGGGLVSLKAAYALKKRGVLEVTVIIKSSHLLIKQLDRESAALVEKELTEAGIKFIYGVNPVAFLKGPDGGVQAVELEDGRMLPAGLVLIGKSVWPNTELVSQAGGQVGKGIVVNEYLETSLPGVYAAGDCIEVSNLRTGTKTTSGLWTLAVEQGRYAGFNMAGQPRKYRPPLTRLNAAQFGAVPVVSVGDVHGGDSTAVVKKDGNYRKLNFANNRLIGFIMTGSVSRAGVYTALIKQARPIDGIKDKLIDGTITGADLMV